MKIRTKEELIDKLDEDFAWRKKELSILLGNLHRNTTGFKTSLRSAIVLLYAHWEGYIKNICEYYLNFVKFQRLNYEELNLCFVALSVKERLTLYQSTNKATLHNEILTFLFNNLNVRSNLPVDNVIKTGSNLNSIILGEILATVGLDYECYALKHNLIDTVLLRNRNSIAHGQFVELDEFEFKILHDEIVGIMGDIKTQITNAVLLDKFRRACT